MRSNNSPSKGKGTPVTVISSDDIAVLSDDELGNKFSAVKRRIDQGRKKHLPTEVVRSLEVEYCYLSREIDIRRNRRASHSGFIASNRSRR